MGKETLQQYSDMADICFLDVQEREAMCSDIFITLVERKVILVGEQTKILSSIDYF